MIVHKLRSGAAIVGDHRLSTLLRNISINEVPKEELVRVLLQSDLYPGQRQNSEPNQAFFGSP